MARHWYAFWWRYGIGRKYQDGTWPGTLMVFDTRVERDVWVDDDHFDDDWHREAVTAREARPIMAAMLDDMGFHADGMWSKTDFVRSLDAERMVGEYRRCLAAYEGVEA